MKRAEKIAQAITACRDRNGRVTAKAIVTAAISRRSVLHPLFEWNNQRAAERQRLDRASDLIKVYLTVTVVHRTQKITVPAYVHDPKLEPHEAGFVTLESMDRRDAEKAVDAEIARCEGAIVRARGVTAILERRYRGLSDRLDRVLEELVIIRAQLKAA